MVDIGKRLENCNFVKTILMLIIVFYHSILFWKGNWFVSFTPSPNFNSDVFIYLADWLNSFHVYGFALVSGYIFRYLKTEKNRYSQFGKFAVTKALRLLVPYVFVAAIWVIPVSVYFKLITPFDIFYKYVLGTSPGQLWFLLMLFWVFIIAYILSDFWENHLFPGFISTLLCFGASLVGSAVFPNIFMIWTALRYVLYFWIGFQLRKYEKCILWRIRPAVYVLVDLAIFALTRIIPSNGGILFKLFGIMLETVLNITGAVMIFMVLQKLSSEKIIKSKAFDFVNKKSMVVYLFHQQIIYFSIAMLNGLLNPWIHSLVNFAVSMGLSIILATFLQKYKLTRFLTGEK